MDVHQLWRCSSLPPGHHTALQCNRFRARDFKRFRQQTSRLSRVPGELLQSNYPVDRYGLHSQHTSPNKKHAQSSTPSQLLTKACSDQHWEHQKQEQPAESEQVLENRIAVWKQHCRGLLLHWGAHPEQDLYLKGIQGASLPGWPLAQVFHLISAFSAHSPPPFFFSFLFFFKLSPKGTFTVTVDVCHQPCK